MGFNTGDVQEGVVGEGFPAVVDQEDRNRADVDKVDSRGGT